MKRSALLALMMAWNTAALAANHSIAEVAPMSASAAWCLQPMAQSAIEFHGLDETEAGREGPDNMVYFAAAPGIAGALASLAAGVATHGAIVSGEKAKHASERAQKADVVLAPYRATLEKLTPDGFTKALLALRSGVAVCPHPVMTGTWLVQVTPMFFLSQSQTSVVAEVVISAWPTDMKGNDRPRATSVKIVSASLTQSEFADQWLASDGILLEQHAADLVSQALDVAMRWEIQGADAEVPIPWGTYRFFIGDREYMERAQRVAGNCHSGVLRTLRATYVAAYMEAPDCVEPPSSGSALSLPTPPTENRD